LIVGIVILAVFMALILLGSITLLLEWNSRQPETGRREPLPSLSYCSSSQLRPCVLSFSLDTRENMVINILTDHRATNVYLKVKQGERENIYKCQTVEGFSSNLACSGEELPPGEAFSFLVVSAKDDIPFAEGTFPIIGLAVATPNIFVTPTFIPAFDRPPK
jgi:hypothetical protein